MLFLLPISLFKNSVEPMKNATLATIFHLQEMAMQWKFNTCDVIRLSRTSPPPASFDKHFLQLLPVVVTVQTWCNMHCKQELVTTYIRLPSKLYKIRSCSATSLVNFQRHSHLFQLVAKIYHSNFAKRILWTPSRHHANGKEMWTLFAIILACFSVVRIPYSFKCSMFRHT